LGRDTPACTGGRAMTPRADEGRSLSERIEASAARTRAAYGSQAASANTDCPLAGGEGVPEHGGNCAECGREAGATRSHSLVRSAEAEAEAARFYDDLQREGNLGGVELSRLNEEKGNMLGVLLCVDAAGETQVLRAFSGAIDESGIRDAEGYSNSIPPADSARAAELERELAQVKENIVNETAASDRALKAYQDAKSAQEPAIKEKIAKLGPIYRRTDIDKPEKDRLAAALKAEKAEIEARYDPEKQAYEQASAKVRKLEAQRDSLTQQVSEQYAGEREITNFKGESKKQKDACTDAARVSDGRTGNCAAPKLLADAQRKGWTPVGIAEIWIGKDLGTQKDFGESGAYVPSCECCRAILGHTLCGLAERQEEIAPELDIMADEAR